jgi:type IV pilus assembly protein PilF
MKSSSLLLVAALLLAGCATNKTDAENPSRAEASAKIHTELAESYYERGQIGIALDELRHVFQIVPDYPPAYSVRGLIHMALREDKEAEEDFLHSLRLDNSDSDSHNNYGWFLCERGRENEGIKQFLIALKNSSYGTPEKAYLNAGTCARKIGETKDAEDFLQKALVLNPDLAQARISLAELEFAQGDFAGARDNFTRYAEGQPDNLSAANLWMGVRIERIMGDKRAEGNYAQQLLKRFPDAHETQLLMQSP